MKGNASSMCGMAADSHECKSYMVSDLLAKTVCSAVKCAVCKLKTLQHSFLTLYHEWHQMGIFFHTGWEPDPQFGDFRRGHGCGFLQRLVDDLGHAERRSDHGSAGAPLCDGTCTVFSSQASKIPLHVFQCIDIMPLCWCSSTSAQ